MNIRLDVMRIDENRRVVVGKVKEVKPGTGEAEGRVVNVVLEGTEYNKDEATEEVKTIDIPFWNSDVSQRADQVIAAKVEPGAIIAAEIYENDGKVTGNRFMYRGRWTYPETAESREKNIIMGTIGTLRTGTSETSGNAYSNVSIPVTTGKDENGENITEWCSVSFWDNDKNKVGTRAGKALKEYNGKKSRAICVCGELDEHEYEGKTYHRYKGFNFTLLPSNK